MAISPWYVGQLVPYFQPELTQDNEPLILTGLLGSNIQLNIINTLSLRQVPGAGSWVIDNASAGLCHYIWSPADVATPGSYKLQVIVNFSGGPWMSDPLPWTVILP
jgi:hypothetical protein